MRYRKTKGYKYLLVKDEQRQLGYINIPGMAAHKYITLDDGELTIREGYAWDGSSVPLKKWFSWIWDSDKHCKTASLVHDALCQLMRESLISKSYKEFADGLYRDMCIEGGMSKFQAGLRYKALRSAGEWGITKRKNPRDKVYTA